MTRSLLRRSRTTWLFSAVLVGVFVLAGTVGAGAGSNAGHSRSTAAWLPIHVDLNWVPNVEFSGIWVAFHKGWFKQAHLNVGTGETTGLGPGVRPYDYSNTPEFENDNCLHHGAELCIGDDDSSAIPIARQAGDNLTGIWAGSQKTPFGFMTCWVPPKPKLYSKCKSNNSVAVKNGKGTGVNITKPSQWKGLTIGYQQDELYVPELMLGSVGLSLSDVKAEEVTFSTSDLTTGQTAAHLIFVNNEPLTLKLQGVKTNVIPGYKYGMKAFYADVMFVNDSQIKKYSSEIKAFVSVVDRGWKWAMHNHKAAADMIVKDYFGASYGGGPAEKKQQEMEISQFASTKDGLSRDSSGDIDGRMTLSRWNTIVHDLKTYPGSLGGQPIITADIKPSDCFTDKFAPPGAR